MSRRRKQGMATREQKAALSRIAVDADEADLLVRIADYHLKSMGLMRYVVRFTASREVRDKYRFVAEESRWLKRFAQTVRDDMSEAGKECLEVSLTPRSLVAFWGRLLSSLNSRRSRRRLSGEDVLRREALAAKLEEAARSFAALQPAMLEDELETRRPAEREWMRRRLWNE